MRTNAMRSIRRIRVCPIRHARCAAVAGNGGSPSARIRRRTSSDRLRSMSAIGFWSRITIGRASENIEFGVLKSGHPAAGGMGNVSVVKSGVAAAIASATRLLMAYVLLPLDTKSSNGAVSALELLSAKE